MVCILLTTADLLPPVEADSVTMAGNAQRDS